MTVTHTYTETDVPVAGVTVRPGDTLVLVTRGYTTKQDADLLRKAMAEKLPGVDVVLIGSTSQALVYRPETE